MAGYIGSKAVTLSTTAADVAGNAVIDGDLTVKGTTVTIDSAAAQEIRLGDNDKMTFGDATGGDLQIYHDGSNSYVKDVGTGDLYLQGTANVRITNTSGQKMFLGQDGGEAQLYYNGAEKLATNSTGIDVTGGVSIDDDSNFSFGDGTTYIQGSGAADRIKFITNASEAMRINSSGNVGIGTSTPSEQLTNYHASNSKILVSTGTNGASQIYFGDNSSDLVGRIYYDHTADSMRFHVNTDERMRIDSSGNLLVGTTSTSVWNGAASKKTIFGGGSGNTVVSMHSNSTSIDQGAILEGLSTSTVSFSKALGSIAFLRENTSTTNLRSYTGFYTNYDGTAYERMRIDSNGQVGINTTTPNNYYSKKFVIDTGSDVQNGMTIVSGTSASGMISFADGTSGDARYRGFFNYAHSTDSLSMGTGGTTRITVDNSGNLLVNTTNAGQPNENAMAFTSGMLRLSHINGNLSNYVYFIYNGLGVGSIANNGGSAVSYNTSSDYRLKTDIQAMTGATDRLKQLSPVNFEWISDGTRTDGFLAHEAQAVVPEAVTGTKDAMRDEEYEVTPAVLDDDGNVVTEAVMGTRSVPDYQGIDQSKLVPLLTAALQEAIAKIETLETEMTSVKARLDALEGN